MKNVTLQEVFDRVVKHLLAQGKKSLSADASNCAYRGFDGNMNTLMCAVGCLIPDNLYKPAIDNDFSETDIESILYKFGMDGLFDFKVIDSSDINFLNFLKKLQYIHDVSPPNKWQHRLKDFAKNNNLEFRVL